VGVGVGIGYFTSDSATLIVSAYSFNIACAVVQIFELILQTIEHISVLSDMTTKSCCEVFLYQWLKSFIKFNSS